MTEVQFVSHDATIKISIISGSGSSILEEEMLTHTHTSFAHQTLIKWLIEALSDTTQYTVSTQGIETNHPVELQQSHISEL